MPTSSNYIHHLHAFRGFAIITIVAAHAWSFMIFWTGSLDSEGLKSLFYLTETLFHGSTLYFAIISGVLFQMVLNERGWQRFFKNKITNVLLPYIVMSVFMTTFYWQYYQADALRTGEEITFVGSALSNVLQGTASIHFWYIPVLMVLFAVTPLFSLLLNRAPWLLLCIALLPLIIARSPFPDFLKPQTFVYFAGAYALGMLVGQYYTRVQTFVLQHRLSIFAVALIASGIILMQYVWGYQQNGLMSSRQTLIYVQKCLICLLVLNWFKQIEVKIPRWLSILGTHAFSIYFLHVLFIGFVIMSVQPYLESYRPAWLIFILGSTNLVIGIVVSLSISLLARRLAGKHSRKIIGA